MKQIQINTQFNNKEISFSDKFSSVSRMNRIAENLFALQTYRGSVEKMLLGRLNVVGKERRETSLPSNFTSITFSESSVALCQRGFY